MGGTNCQIQVEVGDSMCLSLLSGQLAIKTCPHDQKSFLGSGAGRHWSFDFSLVVDDGPGGFPLDSGK